MKLKFLFYIVCFTLFTLSCSNDENTTLDVFDDSTLVCINEETNPSLAIHEGVISQKADTFRVMRDGRAVAVVRLGNPIIVARANDEEPWGFFQFPMIYKNESDGLIVEWSMREDSHTAYGVDSYCRLMSTDRGKTWVPLDRDYFYRVTHRFEYENGNVFQVKTPAAKDVRNYLEFPKPVNKSTISRYDFYHEAELPEELRGVYFELWDRQHNKTSLIHAMVDDSGLLRESLDSLMSVVWWGNIKMIEDSSLIAGVYPTYYQNSEGSVLRSSVSFYKSIDSGYHWTVIGKIPYHINGKSPDSFVFNGDDGFTEPAFEILRDGTYMCVMRTSSTTPMYRTFSKDRGSHWTVPEPFTPNGVRPNLLLLGNGIIVLASGRPGIQLRFCIDGDGQTWTEPIEMLPFVDEDGSYNVWRETCGYPCVMRVDDDSFYIVYSDFLTNDENGNCRKSILFREVQIIKRVI